MQSGTKLDLNMAVTSFLSFFCESLNLYQTLPRWRQISEIWKLKVAVSVVIALNPPSQGRCCRHCLWPRDFHEMNVQWFLQSRYMNSSTFSLCSSNSSSHKNPMFPFCPTKRNWTSVLLFQLFISYTLDLCVFSALTLTIIFFIRMLFL